MARSSMEGIDTIEVKLAQSCLMPHCEEDWPLVAFWGRARREYAIGHGQSCTAAYNGYARSFARRADILMIRRGG